MKCKNCGAEMNNGKGEVLMTYKFAYKCRLCGKIFTSEATGSLKTATRELSLVAIIEEKAQITEKTIHACNENDCGIADLLGYIGYEV